MIEIVQIRRRCRQRRWYAAAAGALGSLLVACLPGVAVTAATPVGVPMEQEATTLYRIGIDAYIWGSPLVIMMRTRAQSLCRTPSNTLANATQLATPENRAVVTPNVDTLYSSAWLDLRRTPLVLSVPAVQGRYYNFQLLDMYTNTFANIGSHATGTAAGRYAIVGPHWVGHLPLGVKRIEAPTPDVWLLGRTLVNGPADLPAVEAIQRTYVLTPLIGTSDTITTTAVSNPGSCTGLPSPQHVAESGAAFYTELAHDMIADPPVADEHSTVTAFAAIGLIPSHAALIDSTATRMSILARSVQVGQYAIKHTLSPTAHTVHGWSYNLHTGRYGSDYVTRAAVAYGGLGANISSESVYFSTHRDDKGASLRGISAYRLHLAAQAFPPLGPTGFWSLTVYDAQHFLVANSLKRYAIGNRTAGLMRNADGTLDIYISARQPISQTANWLPAPTGNFSLTFRTYVPGPSILSGNWVPAPIQAYR